MTTEGITFIARGSECELQEARPPYYGSVFIEKQGPAHVFLNYMGIVISASEELFEFEFDRCAEQYIKQSGGVSLIVRPAELPRPSNMSVIDPSGTIIFWSWHNCIKTDLTRAEELQIILGGDGELRELKRLWIPPVIDLPIPRLRWDPGDIIWPDPGDTFEQLERARRNWKLKKPPWWPPDAPWPFNDNELWCLPPEISRIVLPKIFEEDSNKIARFLDFPESGHPSFFYIYVSQINFDGTLLRRCVAIIKKEPDGSIIQQWISPLISITTGL